MVSARAQKKLSRQALGKMPSRTSRSMRALPWNHRVHTRETPRRNRHRPLPSYQRQTTYHRGSSSRPTTLFSKHSKENTPPYRRFFTAYIRLKSPNHRRRTSPATSCLFRPMPRGSRSRMASAMPG